MAVLGCGKYRISTLFLGDREALTRLGCGRTASRGKWSPRIPPLGKSPNPGLPSIGEESLGNLADGLSACNPHGHLELPLETLEDSLNARRSARPATFSSPPSSSNIRRIARAVGRRTGSASGPMAQEQTHSGSASAPWVACWRPSRRFAE